MFAHPVASVGERDGRGPPGDSEMSVEIAQGIVLLAALYVGLGILVAPILIFRGAARFDPAAAESTRGFRVIVLPGAVLLWPLLLRRFLRAPGALPEEHNAHRAAARGEGARR